MFNLPNTQFPYLMGVQPVKIQLPAVDFFKYGNGRLELIHPREIKQQTSQVLLKPMAVRPRHSDAATSPSGYSGVHSAFRPFERLLNSQEEAVDSDSANAKDV